MSPWIYIKLTFDKRAKNMQRRKIVPSFYFSLYIFTIGGSELLKDILIWVHIVSLEYFSLMCLLCISASLLYIDFVFLESSSSFSCHSKHAWFYVSPLNLRTKIRETYNICLFRFLIFKKLLFENFYTMKIWSYRQSFLVFYPNPFNTISWLLVFLFILIFEN